MLRTSAEASLYFDRAAAQFFIAAGNPAMPFLKAVDHKIDANRKNGPVSVPSMRSTSLVAVVSVTHSNIAAASCRTLYAATLRGRPDESCKPCFGVMAPSLAR